MKKFFYLFFVLFSLQGFAQKYITKTGVVEFEASVPSFEEVKAKNSSVTAILNTENGEFAALVLVKGFRFKNALMEEHFNENYAESDQYPKATFKGTITGFDRTKMSDQSVYNINGSLTFHGQTESLSNVKIKLNRKGNSFEMSGDFKTQASKYGIDIPKIVSEKIAEDIKVSFIFNLEVN